LIAQFLSSRKIENIPLFTKMMKCGI